MNNQIEIAKSCLDKLKNAGSDMAQVTVSCSEKREFNVDGGEFSLFRTTYNRNIVLDVYREMKNGTVSLNSFMEADINKAVSDVMKSVESGKPDPAYAIAECQGDHEIVRGEPNPDVDRFFFRTKELKEQISERYPTIMLEQMICSHNKNERTYADSNETSFHVISGSYEVSLMFSAHRGDKASSFMSAGFYTLDLDTPFLSQAGIEKLISDVEKQVETVPVTGSFVGTVVLSPDCLCGLLSSAISSFASGNALVDGTAIWKDKLGQQVADPSFSLAFAPGNPAILLKQDYTGDGYPAVDFDVIKDGILNSFVASLYVSNKVGVPRSGNTSYAMVMPAGDKSFDELIAGIEHGLYVSRFSGGRPASNGDFSGVVKNSFLIENGKITDAVSETMISGNLAEMLNHPVGYTNERIRDGASLLPFAAFSGITISGK